MINIRRGTAGSELPTVSDVTAQDVEHFLDPEAKGVPELKPNDWLRNETACLEAAVAGQEDHERALAQADLAMLLLERDTGKAKALATEALATGTAREDVPAEAAARFSMGWVLLAERDIRQALSHLQEAEYLFSDLGDRIREGAAMASRLYAAAGFTGAYSAAADLEGPILDLLHDPGEGRDEYLRMWAYSTLYADLSWLAREAKKDWPLCQQYLVLSAAFARAAPEPMLVGVAHLLMGMGYYDQGEFGTARRHFARWGFIGRRNRSLKFEIESLHHISRTYTAESNFAAARAALQDSDTLSADADQPIPINRAVLHTARLNLLMAQELWDDAEEYLTEIRPDIERSRRRNIVPFLKDFLAVYRAKGTLHEHLDIYDRLLEETERLADERGAVKLGTAELQREKERRQEEKRADQLLRSILPASVYAEYVQSGESVQRYYPEAIVFYSDFAGFTKIAAALSPRQVIEELSDLFVNFDLIMSTYKCERIETIGDAYLAVANLSPDGSSETGKSNAVSMARTAVAIQEYLAERNRRAAEIGGSQFVARIGLHCGPIIGGMVGRDRARYGIFGDAVNTAQRLEAACDPGSICISESMYSLLSQAPESSEFVMTEEGTIIPKGKGEMRIWSLKRP